MERKCNPTEYEKLVKSRKINDLQECLELMRKKIDLSVNEILKQNDVLPARYFRDNTIGHKPSEFQLKILKNNSYLRHSIPNVLFVL